MKAVLINGSPRKNWNTHKLLMEAERAAAEAGAATELAHLYDLNYKGCVSCFACKLKESRANGVCVVRDGLRPLLESVMEADVLIIGSPVYYGNLTAETLSFVERLLFPAMQYEYGDDGQPVRTLPKKKNCGLILTMNVPEDGLKVHYGERFSEFGNMIGRILSDGACPVVYSCNTYQFSDYGKYRVSMFDPEQKAAHREKQFPVDMKNAYALGRELCR